MNFPIKPTKFFLSQIKELDKKSKSIIKEKIELIKQNPYRYKRIHGYSLFLFRIRFKDSGKEKRLIYLIDKPHVKLLCILDRGKEYKDLKRYLKKLGYI